MFNPPQHVDNINRLILYSHYPDRASELYFGTPDQVVWTETWERVLEILSDHGDGTSAIVVRDGTIQCFK